MSFKTTVIQGLLDKFFNEQIGKIIMSKDDILWAMNCLTGSVNPSDAASEIGDFISDLTKIAEFLEIHDIDDFIIPQSTCSVYFLGLIGTIIAEDYNQKEFISVLLPEQTFFTEPINFYAGGKPPYHNLSNFALITNGIEHNGSFYPSTEHLFQSFKYIPEQRERFTVNGDLGSVEGFDLVFKPQEVEKKRKYWMKKNNIGIIAKMATNKVISIKLGLTRDIMFESTDELWMEILGKKYDGVALATTHGVGVAHTFKDILLETQGHYLLEFGRGGKRETENGNPPVWSGLIQDGVLYGNNRMGKYLMRVRDRISPVAIDY